MTEIGRVAISTGEEVQPAVYGALFRVASLRPPPVGQRNFFQSKGTTNPYFFKNLDKRLGSYYRVCVLQAWCKTCVVQKVCGTLVKSHLAEGVAIP